MTTPAHYALPAGLAADIGAYEAEVRRFLAGGMPPALFKARRVPRGVYEQRKDGTFMLRVRVAGGALDREQARELAALSREFGDGRPHITTRQDVQLHDLAIGDTPAVMRRLMAAGLTSRGGGGNTVRNVTACHCAGVCPSERFDVTPCAYAVTGYLISLAASYNLPRKFKIAFSGCGADCALARVADLGFIADVRGGAPGFHVLAGGGMGARSRIADPLLGWSRARDVIRVSETVRRLFDRLGDRTDRNRARLRFVFDRIGAAEFRRRFGETAAEVARDGVPDWTGDPSACGGDPAAPPVPPRAEPRAGVCVIRQRQQGYVAVPLHAPLGFLPAADLERIGAIAARFSRESGFRTTISQNLLLRFVKEGNLPALAGELHGLETDVLSPVPLDRFVACAGASTCRLGICLARHAARACADALAVAGVARDALDAMRICINGCPNACGQQPVGAIGLTGAARRAEGRLFPIYALTLGGRSGPGGARFGSRAGEVPAQALPALVRELAADFAARRAPGEDFVEYFDRIGLPHFQAIASRHAAIPGFAERPDFYRDLGADGDFSLAGRGAGESGAGVLEVIRGDLAAAGKAIAPFDIILPAACALLITRGIDARDPDTVLREFERHFIDTGLAAEEFRPLLGRAREFARGEASALEGTEDAALRLRERVELLFSTMDSEFRLHPPGDP